MSQLRCMLKASDGTLLSAILTAVKYYAQLRDGESLLWRLFNGHMLEAVSGNFMFAMFTHVRLKHDALRHPHLPQPQTVSVA